MPRISVQELIRRSKLDGLHEHVQPRAVALIRKAYDRGLNVQITSGFRSFAEQAKLYAQGRTESGNVVTNAEPGESVHNYGYAIDFVPVSDDGSKALWSRTDLFRAVAKVGKKLGFDWGGDWSSFPDMPHLYYTNGLGWRDLKAGKIPATQPFDTTSPDDGMLEFNEKGEEVKQLQEDLLKIGIELPRYGADGHFGEETENAVRLYQRRRGLKVDGLAGENTLANIEEDLNIMENGFKDINKNTRGADIFKRLKEQGVVDGFEDGTLRPHENITRGDMLIILGKALGYDEE